MSDAPKKETVRSPKQQERNEKLRKATKLLKNAGLKAPVADISAVVRMQNEGKPEAEIVAAMKAKQANNNATRKAAKSAPKPPATPKATKKNNNNAASTTSTASTKVKTEKQASRNAGQKSLAQKFKNAGVKFYGHAVKYYTEQKKAGKSNNDIFAEIKANPDFQVQTRARKNTTAKAANVVAPAANKTTAKNKGIAKGSWVCEKCRLVANNTTRKNNNNKNKNNKNKKNGPEVNVNEYMYREL